MKKTLVTVTLLAGAVAGYSQGEVDFTTYDAGTFVQRIYANSISDTPNAQVSINGYTVAELTGSTASGTTPKEKPAGTTVYTGAALTGAGYDAQLYAAAGSGAAYGDLSAVGPVVNFAASGAGAGLTVATAAVNVQVTSVANGPATVAIAAWQNTGAAGDATTLLQAQKDGYEWGLSPLSSFSATGGAGSPPANVPFLSAGSDPNMSFALGLATPEPSTIALGVMGASALLFRRRK